MAHLLPCFTNTGVESPFATKLSNELAASAEWAQILTKESDRDEFKARFAAFVAVQVWETLCVASAVFTSLGQRERTLLEYCQFHDRLVHLRRLLATRLTID